MVLVLTYGMREEAFWINSAQESVMDSCRSSLVCTYWWVTLENLTEVVPLVSLFASVVVCGAGEKDGPWFGPLWDLLATVDSLVRLVLWGLETLSFFYLKCSFGTLFWFCIFSQIFLCKYVHLSINKCYCKSDFSFHCLLTKKAIYDLC